MFVNVVKGIGGVLRYTTSKKSTLLVIRDILFKVWRKFRTGDIIVFRILNCWFFASYSVSIGVEFRGLVYLSCTIISISDRAYLFLGKRIRYRCLNILGSRAGSSFRLIFEGWDGFYQLVSLRPSR